MMSLAIVLALGWRRRHPDLLIATVIIAGAELVNVDAVYLLLDSGLGRRNLLDLGANLLLIVGIAFLSLAMIRVVKGPSYQAMWPFVVMGVTMAVMIGSFAMIPTFDSTTAFMAHHGDLLPAAIYNLTEFWFIGYVMVLTAWVFSSNLKLLRRKLHRFGGVLLVGGCTVILINVLVVTMMDISHLLSSVELLKLGQSLYGPFDLLGMILLCGGIIMVSFTRTPNHEIDRLAELEPLMGEVLKRGRSVQVTPGRWHPSLRYRMRKNLTDIYDGVGAGVLVLSPEEQSLVAEVDTRLSASTP